MQADLFHCEYCSGSFHRREHYQRHLRTHTKERPYSCTECGRSFSRVDSLTRHCALVHNKSHVNSSAERQRVAHACKLCRLSKLRCDGHHPCGRCLRYGDECCYEERKKRRTTGGRMLSSPLPQAKRHQAQVPEFSNEIGARTHVQGDFFQNANIFVPSVIGREVMAAGGMAYNNSSQGLNDSSNPKELIVEGNDQGMTKTPRLNHQDTLDPKAPRWESLLGVEDFDFDTGLGISLWPDILDSQIFNDSYDDIWQDSAQPSVVPNTEAETFEMPTALTSTAAADIYNRECISEPTDQEVIEPRQYHPTNINVDAQLSFPDLQQTSTVLIDQEDLAHVKETQQPVVNEVTKLATDLQSRTVFPPFQDLKIPPASILNAWTQLYFEHFHPIFPILHKASFGYPESHWLLVFTVSAIGAQFSQIPHAQTCSRAMQEMIRRQAIYLCEIRNKTARELWLTQVVLLNHIGLRYSGDRRSLEVAEFLQALPVTLARRKQLFTDVLSEKSLSELDLTLRQRWHIWTLDEERRRAGFATWLVDSGFQSHFDITPILRVGELRNSLPRGEDEWSASSSVDWTSYSTQSDLEHKFTLHQILTNGSWIAAWNETGVLGKQTLLQLLTDTASIDPEFPFSSGGKYTIRPCQANEVLKTLLAILELDKCNISTTELKAYGTYKLMILSALMSYNTPCMPLLATAVRIRYQRFENKEFGELIQEWNKAPQKRRRAALYAAEFIESFKSQNCAHYSTPVMLFRATLTLWLYTILDKQSTDEQAAASSPSVVLGRLGMSDSAKEKWVESGNGHVKLKGVGSIFTPGGRRGLLEESISAMHTIRSWGISKIYKQLLCQLREA